MIGDAARQKPSMVTVVTHCRDKRKNSRHSDGEKCLNCGASPRWSKHLSPQFPLLSPFNNGTPFEFMEEPTHRNENLKIL